MIKCYLILYFIVLISVICDDGYVRLVNDTTQSILIKDTLSQGRVEVCRDGAFMTVCDSGWNNIDASVLCSELGFSKYGKLMVFCV